MYDCRELFQLEKAMKILKAKFWSDRTWSVFVHFCFRFKRIRRNSNWFLQTTNTFQGLAEQDYQQHRRYQLRKRCCEQHGSTEYEEIPLSFVWRHVEGGRGILDVLVVFLEYEVDVERGEDEVDNRWNSRKKGGNRSYKHLQKTSTSGILANFWVGGERPWCLLPAMFFVDLQPNNREMPRGSTEKIKWWFLLKNWRY